MPSYLEKNHMFGKKKTSLDIKSPIDDPPKIATQFTNIVIRFFYIDLF
jgi:hypothetical protein